MVEPSIAENVAAVRSRIAEAERRAGRSAGSVTLAAVTKTVSAERIREAAAAGVRIVAENYVQEAGAKHEELTDLGLEWHLIGRLQKNKARPAAALFSMVQTIDRIEVANALRRWREPDQPLQALVQVKLDLGEQRAGVRVEGVAPLLEELSGLDGITLRGLMGVPPVDGPGEPQRSFAVLREIWERARQPLVAAGAGFRWDTLSMGMSADFELAIAEGATLVRVGSAIFGKRAEAVRAA